MKKFLIAILVINAATHTSSQSIITPFEKSKGIQTTTYSDCIKYYTTLDKLYNNILIKNFDTTDAEYPLQLVMFSSDNKFDPAEWHKHHKIVILINNGIHPGEPDGIDASMMLLRDAANHKIKINQNIILAVIPVYNIGGCLNRNSFSRTNQNGPESYGFRGNAQNLDLNRDFIKADSKDAKAFEKIFQWVNPDILIDNHVSDGADYQHTMTLLTTQYNKLAGQIGQFLHNVFEPELYKGMEEKKWSMCPYVNLDESDPGEGWIAFYDSPRYSSGYAALFETIAFMTETHMLKRFTDRVNSTYAFIQTVTEKASVHAEEIINKRNASLEAIKQQHIFPLSWKADSTQNEFTHFKGYEAATKTSDVTGMPRLFYDHSKPYDKEVKFYNIFAPAVTVEKPKAYIIPKGWHDAATLLKLNRVTMNRLMNDTTIEVQYYHIDDYKSISQAYEKHHFNYDIKLTTLIDTIHFLKGDYIIFTGQSSDRYIIETLEPLGDDSFFRWNFFDAILQQKEGYSDYCWEDVAEQYLQQHQDLKQRLEEKKKTDSSFAASAHAQLDYVYKNSPYYEASHLRYPVYRLMK